jgi:hypothetical protein
MGFTSSPRADIRPNDILSGTSGFSALPEDDSIYAFHYYSAPCPANLSLYLDEREADARRLNAVLFASEFWMYAGDQRGYEEMVAQFNEYETRRIAYTGWLYKNYAGSLPGGTCTGCGSSFFTDDGRTQDFLIRALARPFASAVSGEVTRIAFNVPARTYTLEFVAAASTAETEVTVPEWYSVNGTVHVTTTPGSVKWRAEHIRGRRINEAVYAAGQTLLFISAPADVAGQAVQVIVSVSGPGGSPG